MLRFANYLELKQALQGLKPEDVLVGVELTPELAQDILNHDPVNRPVRKANLHKLTKDMQGGHWNPAKSPFIRFTPDGRLNDGQHRCMAAVASGQTIIVHMVVVTDTVGVDQGANRSLADQLKIQYHLASKEEAELAASVTKAICEVPSATDREQLAVFEQHHSFILECVHKSQEWLADKQNAVLSVIKPQILATTRAQAITIDEEPANEVDELLEDVVNGGHNAPEGSVRRAIAAQIWNAMESAYTKKKGAKAKDVMQWVTVGLTHKRKGVTKSVVLTRFSSKTRKKSKVAEKIQGELIPA